MDVFISYNRRDTRHAAALNTWLGSQRITTFFDQLDLGGGKLWLPDLERRIEHDAQAVAVVVGPAGLGNTQQYEYQLALTRQAVDPAFPVIPVILPDTPDWRVPRGFLGLQTWISFAAASDPMADPVGLQRLLAAIRREGADADTIRGTICPYKGLGFFEEADSAVFFGRDAEADALLATVTDQRVAALIGRSGSGKSSLVRAGLLPRLRRRPGAGVWASLVIRPGEEPLVALADALSPTRAQEDPLDRRRRLEQQAEALRTDKPDILAGTLRDRMGAARLQVDRLLIVVDQAEELFSPPWRLADAAAIKQFHADTETLIRLLVEAAVRGPSSVVLTIRSDFFDPLMHSPFAPVLKDALVQLGRVADLHPCIERPAALVGLRFSPGLVDRIVDEVGPEESNLPLLSHALERTWQRRASPLLSADAYDAAGGVAQAINQAAKDCYESLSPGERNAARRLFLRLVRPGEGTAHVRIRAAVPEDAEERHVMEAFAHPGRRLLFVGEQAGVPVVEVAHEALVRGWDTLRLWVEDSHERLRVRDAVMDWRASAAADELIPAGSSLLQRARDLLADPGDVRFDRGLQAYVERSIAAADAATIATQRRRRWTIVALAAVALIFGGLSATTGLFYLLTEQQRTIAEEQRRHAVEQQAIAEQQRGVAEAQRKSADEQRAIAEQQRADAEQQRKSADEQRALAEAQRSRAETSAKVAQGAARGLIVDVAEGLAYQPGISGGTVKHILDTALGVIDTMLRYSPGDPALVRLKWGALGDFANVYVQIGDTNKQIETARQALAIASASLAAAPDDAQLQRDVAVSHLLIGDALVARGDLPGALHEFRSELASIEKAAARDPTNTGWQVELTASYERIGEVLMSLGNLPEALDMHRKDLAVTEALVTRDPDNGALQHSLSISQEKVGDVLEAQGKLPDALEIYRKSLTIREAVAARNPGNTLAQHDLAISYRKVGEVLREQIDLPGALDAYHKGLSIDETLAARDASNVQWALALSIDLEKVGDVLLAQNNLPGALETYRKCLAIRQTLVGRDANNIEWLDAIGISYEKVGDVLFDEGDLTGALEAYRKFLGIKETLSARDAGNAESQRTLSMGLGRVAKTLLKQGKRDEARPIAARALAQIRATIARFPNDPRIALGLSYYEGLLRRTGGKP